MGSRVGAGILIGVALLLGAGAAGAQGREEPRRALVIGNATYREAPLRNPVNDARAMSRVLRDLGFTVVTLENASKKAIESAVIEFGQRLATGGVGLFYYAGHGLQVRGRNYLVPVDAEIEHEAATRVQAVDVDLLLEQMAEAKNRVNVVILDACRNNPFERRLRGSSRGLAAVDAARGTLIAYATAPGSVAADGEGGNGLYTEELVKSLRVPNLKVEEVFKRVRVSVTERSKGNQTPWESSSLTGDLVVNDTGGPRPDEVRTGSSAEPAAGAPAAPGVAAAAMADREALFWTSIKDATDPAAFDAYLKQYPDGTFADLARLRMVALTAPAPAPASPAPVEATRSAALASTPAAPAEPAPVPPDAPAPVAPAWPAPTAPTAPSAPMMPFPMPVWPRPTPPGAQRAAPPVVATPAPPASPQPLLPAPTAPHVRPVPAPSARRFDGTWVGVARDTQGARACPDSSAVQVTVAQGVLQGTVRHPAGGVSTFGGAVQPDGSVATAELSGRFTGSEFRGRWQRRGPRGACEFEVTLKRQ